MKKAGSKRRNALWIVFAWMVVVILAIVVGFPTALILRTRSQVLSAVRSASSIRLEEYSFPAGRILTSRVLAANEFQRVTHALPFTCVYGLPLVRRCFSPHHRVMIVDKTGSQQTSLEVCFGCEQIRFSGNGIDDTPVVWRQPLRQLFLRHNIPIRDRYEPDIEGLDVTLIEAAR